MPKLTPHELSRMKADNDLREHHGQVHRRQVNEHNRQQALRDQAHRMMPMVSLNYALG